MEDSESKSGDDSGESCDRDPNQSLPVDPLKTQSHHHLAASGALTEVGSSSGAGPGEKVSIGPYRLIQKLGEGGMGAVWMAEQSQPVKRRVALKLIKTGVGSREIIARFEAERQALSMMNHPNIARILDAGTTDDGQPYFVMELVTGVPLTTYCDQNRLGIDERLKMFTDVCLGVQHAHQKGIIHRDLKPGNIIVGIQDGHAVPKIIDFGLAKAMESTQKLTDQSLFTGIGQILGTLKYMSPEQASLDTVDIDTRTDIYALGVILYELLTGSTPLDDSSIKGQAALKILEFIRDKDPVKPSSKLGSSTDAQRSVITGQRKTDSVRLSRILAGDLDWVVMKALEKDRTRRYESASGFAADISRYLNNEPVVARPPSLNYRARKFVRKNRAGVIAAGLLGVTLLAGLAATTIQMRRAQIAEGLAENRLVDANQARESAEKRRQEAEAAKLTAEAETRKAEAAATSERLAREEEARQRGYAEAITHFVKNDFLALTSVEGQYWFNNTDDSENIHPLDKDSTLRDLLDRASEKLDSRTDLAPQAEAVLRRIIGSSYRGLGAADVGIPFLERAVQLSSDNWGVDDAQTLSSQDDLAQNYQAVGELDAALKLFNEVFELTRTKFGADHPDTLRSMNNLAAAAYLASGQLDESMRRFLEVFELTRDKPDADPVDTITSMGNLVMCYQIAGQLEKALTLSEETYELSSATYGTDHPVTLMSLNNLVSVYRGGGQLDKALSLAEEAHVRIQTKFGADHPRTLAIMNSLAACYIDSGQSNKALPLLMETLDRRRAVLGFDHPETLISMNNLSQCHKNLGQLDKAAPLFEETFERMRAKLGPEHPNTLFSMQNLAQCYMSDGQMDKAVPLFEETLGRMRAKFGPDNTDTMSVMNDLALSYYAVGQLSKAVPLFEETLDRRRVQLGPDHPDTLISMNNLARTWQASGQLDKGLPLFEETLERRRTTLGPNHPDTIDNMNNLAGMYVVAKQQDKARQLFDEAAQRIEEQQFVHANADQIIHNTIFAFEDAREFEQALIWRRKWLTHVGKTAGVESTLYAGELASLGLSLLQQKKWSEAETELLKCLVIREKSQPDEWTTFHTQSLLGGCLLGQETYSKAEPLLLAGYEGMKKQADALPSTAKKRLTESIDRLIEFYTATGNPDEVKKWEAEKEKLPIPQNER